MEMEAPIFVAGKTGKAVRKGLMQLSLLFAHSEMIHTPVSLPAGSNAAHDRAETAALATTGLAIRWNRRNPGPGPGDNPPPCTHSMPPITPELSIGSILRDAIGEDGIRVLRDWMYRPTDDLSDLLRKNRTQTGAENGAGPNAGRTNIEGVEGGETVGGGSSSVPV